MDGLALPVNSAVRELVESQMDIKMLRKTAYDLMAHALDGIKHADDPRQIKGKRPTIRGKV